MEVITTNRLILEPLGLDHCTEKYLAWLNNPTVYAYLETRGNQTLEMLKAFIEKQVNNKIYIWAVTIKDGNQHIGNIKIDPISWNHGYGEYGILMGDKNEWGKGYAKEASLAVINYFFETKKLRKINLGVVKNNIAAVKLYENIGFETEGVYKKQVVYDGIYHDVIRMALFNPKLK
jgi:[ribosomal protein S5]-alanine N-acetyltransferase